MTTRTDARPVVLVGLMASGKTSVAARLAQALGRRFRDSDERLEQRYGQTAAEQVAQYGAEVLHDREAAVLQEALAERPAAVIAAAASVADDPGARAALAGPEVYVVWLDAPPEVLAQRIGTGNHRPHYHPDPVRMLSDQYRHRAPHFRALADRIVDVSEATPDQVVASILASLPAGHR